MKRIGTLIGIFPITAALLAAMARCPGSPIPPPSRNLEIHTWYDLDAVRNNLTGHHTLMNDLDSTTPGYEELASPTANGGNEWVPIGGRFSPFTGSFDGRGYEIRNLFINSSGEFVGLFGDLDKAGSIKSVGVVNATVDSGVHVGCLVGHNAGTLSDSHSTGSITGGSYVGGLVGSNTGTVSNSYSTASVHGYGDVGGLVGNNDAAGTVSKSYSNGTVNGQENVGGLVGRSFGTVDDSYSAGSVTGGSYVGGLVGGVSYGTVSNSYSTGIVTGGSYVGGLVGFSGGTVSNSNATGKVVGEKDVGGLAGICYGAVSNSYASGTASGTSWLIGGLVGRSFGTVDNSYSTGVVTGESYVGSLVGINEAGATVSNSFWDTETSGEVTSDGGTGKNTTEMQDIATFSAWNITAVANSSTRDPAYIWNIVNNLTYPFLSWEP